MQFIKVEAFNLARQESRFGLRMMPKGMKEGGVEDVLVIKGEIRDLDVGRGSDLLLDFCFSFVVVVSCIITASGFLNDLNLDVYVVCS